VHIYEESSAEIDRILLFKKFLSDYPDAKKEYASLKRILAQKYPDDIYNYCLKKTEFVDSIDGQSGFHGFRMVQALTDKEQKAYHQILQAEIYDELGIKMPIIIFDIHVKGHFHIVLRKDLDIIGISELIFRLNASVVLSAFVIHRSYQNKGNGHVFLKML